MAWYNNNWTYRKSHLITGASGAGSDYQVKLTVHYGVGTDSGENVYLGSNGKTDFSDLRFTDNDETTLLDYWVQEKTDSDNAVVWVKVADDLGSNATIYIYYGNAGASTASSGDSTFLFFDDFEDASIDAGKWTKDIENGTITESGGYLRCGGGIKSGSFGHNSLGSEVGYAGFQDNAVLFRARNSADGIGEVAFRGDYGTNVGYKARFDARSNYGGSSIRVPPYSGWGLLIAGDGDDPSANTWYNYEIRMVGTSIDFLRNGVSRASGTDATYGSAGEIALQNHYGDHTDYDWVAVRKLVATEPAHSTWGAQEEVSTATTVTNIISIGNIVELNNISSIIGA
jgi:hypothetical protein